MGSVSPGLSCTCPNHQPKVKVRAARHQGGDCRRGPPSQESLKARTGFTHNELDDTQTES